MLLAEAEAAVSAAEQVQPVRWETFVAPLDDATERLWRAWGLVGHLQGVVNTPELREAYNSNLPRVTRFASALGQNLALYASTRRWPPARRPRFRRGPAQGAGQHAA
jgi:oligopeptidase A